MFISARVPSRPHTFHAREKEFSSDKKEKEQPFFRDATFCLCCLPSVPSSEKRRKIYRGIIGHGRKKSRNAKTASSLFRFSKSNKPKRKQTGRCAEAQGLVVVESQRVVLHPAARWVTTPPIKPQEPPRKTYLFLGFVFVPQAKPQITPKLWMINVCRVRFCLVGEQGY